MDAGTFSAGVGIGLIIGSFAMHITRRLERKLIASQRELIAEQGLAVRAAFLRLAALKRNCFITNELGHRVKYRNASPERRAMAEAE